MSRNWYNANSMDEQEELAKAALAQRKNMRHYETNEPLDKLIEDINALEEYHWAAKKLS